MRIVTWLTLFTNLFSIAITNVGAAVFDDVIPGRAKWEAICWTLLTCRTDNQANLASFTAILRFVSKRQRRLNGWKFNDVGKEGKQKLNGFLLAYFSRCTCNRLHSYASYLKKFRSVIVGSAVTTWTRFCSHRSGWKFVIRMKTKRRRRN